MSNNAKTNYNMRNYEQIHIWVPLGTKDIVVAAAKECGESVNRYVATAIERRLQADNDTIAKMRLDIYQKIG